MMSSYLKKTFLTFSITIGALFVQTKSNAQGIAVTNFYLAETDLTAQNRNSMVLDQNGEKCALIRIQTTEKGFVFDVGSIGIQQIEDNHTGEIWLYVPYGVKHLDIRHSSYGSLLGYNFPISITKARTYILNLRTSEVRQSECDQKIAINNNVSRKVLFSMKENERIYESEYVANLNIEDNRFACVLVDTLSGKKTFVWNGIRKASSLGLEALHVDLDNYAKCVLRYAHEGSKSYNELFFNGKIYGPYDGWVTLLSENQSRWCEYKGGGMLGIDKPYRRGWVLKDYFVFKNMGFYYIFDHGKISRLPSKYIKNEDNETYADVIAVQSDIIKGRFGTQKIKMDYKNQSLIINGKVYKHYTAKDAKTDSENFEKWGELISNGSNLVYASLPSEEVLVNISTGKIQTINKDQTFDYEHFKIIKEPENWDRFFERKDASIQYDVDRLAIVLQDESLNNTFMSTLKTDYVQINNQKFGNGPALSAIYDKKKNSFVWTTFEKNELVMYQVYL